MGPHVEVTLEDVLVAREQRVLRQQIALEHWQQPLISLTLVMPGPLKNSSTARYLAEVAADELLAFCARNAWTILAEERIDQVAGPEALYIVAAEAEALKRALTRLEEEHPLGRLWDMDVIDPRQGSLSRRTLGLESRRCLLCEQPGHACARARTHPLEELLRFIEQRVDAYRQGRESTIASAKRPR